jgi:tetrahydromethanopterin S-methyltransferase subunit B
MPATATATEELINHALVDQTEVFTMAEQLADQMESAVKDFRDAVRSVPGGDVVNLLAECQAYLADVPRLAGPHYAMSPLFERAEALKERVDAVLAAL